MSIGNHPAFPCEAQGDRSVPQEHDYLQNGVWSSKFPGLMIRDHIAVVAMSGLLASEAGVDPYSASWAAERAYQIADAMLAERNKAKPEKAMQHVAYYDEGQFHWMSGIAPRDCELFAAATGEV